MADVTKTAEAQGTTGTAKAGAFDWLRKWNEKRKERGVIGIGTRPRRPTNYDELRKGVGGQTRSAADDAIDALKKEETGG